MHGIEITGPKTFSGTFAVEKMITMAIVPVTHFAAYV